MNEIFEMLAGVTGGMPGLQEGMPFSIRGVRDSFMSGGHWMFWLCLLAPAAVLVGSAWWWWRQNRREKQRQIINNPEKLFEGLLAQVKLAEDDKDLLREVTKAARLRHPAMCLLSPELLDVSRRAWLAEKNEKEVQEKSRRIEEISKSLYDQATPSGARRIKEEFSGGQD